MIDADDACAFALRRAAGVGVTVVVLEPLVRYDVPTIRNRAMEGGSWGARGLLGPNRGGGSLVIVLSCARSELVSHRALFLGTLLFVELGNLCHDPWRSQEWGGE